MNLTGLHHVSGMTADAPQNLHFYTQVLGLRLVKKTVNQDDTSAYHLFYGDELGRPGTEATFFDIPNLGRNRPGTSSITNVALRVSDRDALHYFAERLAKYGVTPGEITERAGRASLTFADPEGQSLQLVTDNGEAGGTPWNRSPVPQKEGIKGLGPVSLTVKDANPTVRLLTDVLNFTEAESYTDPESEKEVFVFATGSGGAGTEVHLHERPDLPVGRLGRGGMHHVAFRVPDAEAYGAWLEHLAHVGVPNSGPIDRYYFRSIYFREPNGILFELATDGPGFATDEDAEYLGERLSLPPFLEGRRTRIEARLTPLETAPANA